MTREAEASEQVGADRPPTSAAPTSEGQTSAALALHDADPIATAEFIAQHPGQERQILEQLHRTRGNAYVQHVLGALGNTSQRPATHGAPRATNVADATKEELNVALRVLVYSGDRVVKRWDTKGHWEGPLPVTYHANHTPKGWVWDDALGRQVRVNTKADGGGGQSVESFAGTADRIVVYAQPIDAVTIDKDAEKAEKAPGHAATKEDAGDGSTTEIKPGKSGIAAKESGTATSGEASPTTGDGTAADSRGGDGKAVDEGEGDVDVDAFEQSIGIAPDEESDDTTTTGSTAGGQKKNGVGQAGGDQGWRTGDDADIDGTGPGGEHAKAGGLDKGGQEDAESNDGTEHGDKAGYKLGSEHGQFDGQGSDKDGGVRGAMALGGGVLAVPAALRGLVELILLWGQGDITGATSDAFKKGVGKFANAAAARKVLASEARQAAAKELKQALKQMANNPAYKALSIAERKQMARMAYWEMQRRYFKAYMKAAKQAQREAKAMLRKAKTPAGKAAAMEKKTAADMADEAAQVQPVAGRLPQNHQYAGKEFPREQLPAQYRSKGLRFKEDGYPDFSPYAKELPNGKKAVKIEYTGSRAKDFAAANRKAGLAETPEDWVWHHSEDIGIMELIPRDLHDVVKHTGGVAGHRAMTGAEFYGP